MAVTKFWRTIYSDSLEGAVAYVDDSVPDELKNRPGGGWVETPVIIGFTVDEPDAEDWTATNSSLRLFSSRLREVIDRNLGERDCVQWLPARVKNSATGEITEWHILHFPEIPPVVSETHSVRSASVIVKEVLDEAAVRGRRVFVTSPYSNGWVVSDAVRKDIEAAECTGISFRPIHTAPSDSA